MKKLISYFRRLFFSIFGKKKLMRGLEEFIQKLFANNEVEISIMPEGAKLLSNSIDIEVIASYLFPFGGKTFAGHISFIIGVEKINSAYQFYTNLPTKSEPLTQLDPTSFLITHIQYRQNNREIVSKVIREKKNEIVDYIKERYPF